MREEWPDSGAAKRLKGGKSGYTARGVANFPGRQYNPSKGGREGKKCNKEASTGDLSSLAPGAESCHHHSTTTHLEK